MRTEFINLIQTLLKYLAICNSDQSSYTKEDMSPVTIADIGVQTLIHQMIQKFFPQDRIYSEEHSKGLSKDILAQTLKNLSVSGHPFTPQELNEHLDYRGKSDSNRFWFIDPIDGTKGYIRRDQYAVAIACYEENTPLLGYLICPNLPYPHLDSTEMGTVFFWAQGQNAQQHHAYNLNQKMILPCHSLKEPVMLKSVDKNHGNLSINDKLMEKLKIVKSLSLDSQVKYGILSRGEASIYLRMPRDKIYKEKVWDHGAGFAILKAAGGNISDIQNQALDFTLGDQLNSNLGVLATHHIDHTLVYEELKTLFTLNELKELF